MRRRHPDDSRAGFHLLATTFSSLPTRQRGARRRNAESVHRFAAEVFARMADRSTERPSPSRENGVMPAPSDADPTARRAR